MDVTLQNTRNFLDLFDLYYCVLLCCIIVCWFKDGLILGFDNWKADSKCYRVVDSRTCI